MPCKHAPQVAFKYTPALNPSSITDLAQQLHEGRLVRGGGGADVGEPLADVIIAQAAWQGQSQAVSQCSHTYACQSC
jgi:hypothetical protein